MKNLCCCSTLFCYFKSNVFVRTSIFFTELLLELFCVSLYLSNGIRKKFCGALSCNGIVFLSACKRNKSIFRFFLKSVKKSSHKFIGIRSVLVNLGTGMSAHKSTDFDLYLFSFSFYALDRDMADTGKTAGTADPETSLRFRIQIDKSSSLQHAAVQTDCTKKTNLLINREQYFKRRVWNICTVKKGKAISNCNTIITAKRCSVGCDITIFYRDVQTIFCKIMIYIRSFFTYHVHVALDDHCGRILIS